MENQDESVDLNGKIYIYLRKQKELEGIRIFWRKKEVEVWYQGKSVIFW